MIETSFLLPNGIIAYAKIRCNMQTINFEYWFALDFPKLF
nr:MAG TPA_asm: PHOSPHATIDYLINOSITOL-4,5-BISPHOSPHATE 3-KINASE CATALYTIC SUBUNIT ALPHA, CANCER, SH2 DOMAIN, SH3.4A [Caudoviricetes sp.]